MQVFFNHILSLLYYICRNYPRFDQCRKKFVASKKDGKKGRLEKYNIADFVKKEDSTYIDIFSDFKWTSLDQFCKERGQAKLKTLKAKKDFVERLGLAIQCDDEGVEGVAVAVNPPGVKSMRQGKRIAVTHERSAEYDDRDAATEAQQRSANSIRVAATTEQVPFLFGSCV